MEKFAEIIHKQFPTQPDLGKFVDFTEILCDEDKAGLENFVGIVDCYLLTIKYNNLLKQPLELKRLVAEKDGEVINKESFCTCKDQHESISCKCYDEYQKAMESVWYEGWQFDYREFSDYYRNSLTEKMIYYHENWKGFAQWGSSKGATMILSDMINQPVTIEFWKELVK